MDPLNNEELDIAPDVIEPKSISDVVVEQESITKPIKSPNYKLATTGWRLNSNGVAEFNSIYGALAGTKIYYVSDSAGGTTDRQLTFKNGVLISET